MGRELEEIKIIDVIKHRNKHYTQTMIVVDRDPVFEYEKDGSLLIAHDSGFFNFYVYDKPSKHFQALAVDRDWETTIIVCV